MFFLRILCYLIRRGHFLKHYSLVWRIDGPKKFSRLSLQRCRLCKTVVEKVVEVSTKPPGSGWSVGTRPPTPPPAQPDA